MLSKMNDSFQSPILPKKNKCCVEDCKDRYSTRHRFPKKYPEIYNIWIALLKPPDYQNLSVDQMYNKYYVCHQHFDPKCLVPTGNKWAPKKNAVPTLNIPDFDNFDLESVAGRGAVLVDGAYIEGTKHQNLPPEILPTKLPFKIRNFEGPVVLNESPSTSITGSSTPKMDTLEGPESPTDIPSTSKTRLPRKERMVMLEREGPVVLNESPSTSKTGSSTPEMDTLEGPKLPAALPSISKRKYILRDIDTSRSIDLTPKAKSLYHTLTKWGTKINYMNKRLKSYKERLTIAENFVESTEFCELLKYVNNPTYRFVVSQVRNQLLKPKGRRYTLDEKILALGIFKSSGKAYRFLSKMFSLPTPTTLRSLLAKIPLQPGLNRQILQSLKNNVDKMKSDQEKVCVLMFDELAIDSIVSYNRKNDIIEGLEDYGSDRKALLADHANVFFLKGIYRQWRQPLCFTFSNGPIKSLRLKDMIKSVINECQKIGLEIVATVCDQGCNNQAAIKMLLDETNEEFLRSNTENRLFGFIVNGREIIPLFDVPHLFKGIRNNLLTKNLHFVLDGENKVAKWVHIEQFYKLDSSEPFLRLCSKLTDQHVVPNRINKMKVKLCTQVFSHTVGALMKRLSRWDTQDNFNLGPDVSDTADLILFLDDLFDSLNVTRKSKAQAKPLKCSVTENSAHQDFWRKSLKVVDSMKFYCLKNNKFVSTPTLKNLKHTISGFMYLTNIVLTKQNFKFLLTGAINQDPLENFFSYIRSHGVRNTNPSIPHFIASFKSLLTNNFMAAHSPGSNCEKDSCEEALDNLRIFLTGEIASGIEPLETKDQSINFKMPADVNVNRQTRIGKSTMVYMSGFFAKYLSKNIKCNICISHLLKRDGSLIDDTVIEAKQYDRAKLMKPGNYLYVLVSNSLLSLFYLIPRVCSETNLSKILSNHLKKYYSFTVMNCPQHELGDKICQAIVKCSLFWWCRSVNRISKGVDSKFGIFVSRNPKSSYVDPIKLQAHKKNESRRKNKNKREQL